MTDNSQQATFTSLGLVSTLVERLQELEYSQPTPIQSHAIPHILEGRDLVGGANTGSGKTAAFALPLLQKILEQDAKQTRRGNFVSHLVLVPTRELASQVAYSIKSYSYHLRDKLKTVAVFGGVSVNPQMLALRGGSDIIVATPGRLLDLVSSNAIKLDQVKTLVLDEADRMLSLGFTEELNKILALLPANKQTLLFSATFPEKVTN